MDLRKVFKRYGNVFESFVYKTSSKKNDELITKADAAFVPDGVYILHETLGVKGVEGWNPEDNEGVVGILLVEDDHQIVVALEDSPEKWTWSKKLKLVNQPVDKLKDAESDFNGEEYCIKLNSPDFPAAYYCLNYKKGGRNWHLPSSGELWLIYNHLEEIQNALETVGGQKFVTTFNNGVPCYWSSTEYSVKSTLHLPFDYGHLVHRNNKISTILKVRPVSNFNLFELKESFTKKISKKNSTEVIGKSERMFLEESIAQMVYSFGKYDVVPDIDKKHILGYKLPFGCLPKFFEGNSNKVLDNGDVVKRTETRSLMGYKQTYEIIASHIYFNSSRKKVYVGMYRPSPLNQSESSPKIYNLYGAASSGILELDDFSIDELRQILQNIQERTKMKKPLRKKIVSRIEESFVNKTKKSSEERLIDKSEEVFDIDSDLKKFVFENSFTFTNGWYYFDIKDFDSIPVCHEFLDDLEINDYNEYLYTYGNILLKKGKSWKDSKLMVEIDKSDSSEMYDDVVKTVPWDYLSDYQGEQKKIVDCLLET